MNSLSQEYNTLHKWVSANKIKAGVCSDCHQVKKTAWANISNTYRRDLSDWRELCYSCHKYFDSSSKPKLFFAECINCNELFSISPSRIGKKFFCSNGCYTVARLGKPRSLAFAEVA